MSDVFTNGKDLRTEAEAFPVADPGIELKGSRILVQLRKEKAKSKGGIILTSETKSTERWNETIAKVIQIGPLAYKDVNTMEPFPEGPWAEPGDIVRVIKFGGDRFTVPASDDPNDGVVVFIICQATEVIAKIKSWDYAAKQFPAYIE
jgi:co-chaperonin GroES (HSP10)